MTELDSRRLLEKYGREARDDLAGSAEVLQALPTPIALALGCKTVDARHTSNMKKNRSFLLMSRLKGKRKSHGLLIVTQSGAETGARVYEQIFGAECDIAMLGICDHPSMTEHYL